MPHQTGLQREPPGLLSRLGGPLAVKLPCHDEAMDVTALAALVFAVVAAGVVAFQVSLAFGAPWGAYAMGGAFPGQYPPLMRVAAAVQAVVIALVALGVLSAAGLVMPDLAVAFPWLIWVAVAFSALAVVLNALSGSAGERRIWVPVAIVLLASSLLVALTVT